ncbi:hypothetical protein LEM8419_01444 [Neolewinella maritima]|uniref:OmpA-like domain-containing protein n=1 Tax=Neolewinella maritima TaxID=1383882 RepID=A0ABM9B0Y3_9BACT|nr:OmpA family protein [Neolewinella maritima]CAH1000293.1 hypothetical protein LEM8419_01444 [Neolewinella maritima]
MKYLPGWIILFCCITACVPKAQYDTLVTERNYYRTQSLETDSIATVRLRTARDSATATGVVQRSELRQIEDLTATNLALNTQLSEVRAAYRDLLKQEGQLGSAVSGDQEVAQQSALLSQREAALERRERELDAMSQQLNSLPRTTPTTYNSKNATAADPMAPLPTRDRLAEELRQVLLAAADSNYVIRLDAVNAALRVTLGEQLLFEDDRQLSLSGRQLLRQLATTLRAYPKSYLTVVGHAESVDGDARLAYQHSTERAIAVVTQLQQFGLDAGRMVAGGTGFYGTTAAEDQLRGAGVDRRTDLLIVVRD